MRIIRMAFPENQNLARQLVACEAAHSNAPEVCVDSAMQVVEKLRLRLVKLTGVDGFRSLLSRALTLAGKEAPSLQTLQIRADGTLEGLDEIGHSSLASEDGTVLVAFLLELLVTFIGEPLTFHLVRDAWLDTPLELSRTRTEEKA